MWFRVLKSTYPRGSSNTKQHNCSSEKREIIQIVVFDSYAYGERERAWRCLPSPAETTSSVITSCWRWRRLMAIFHGISNWGWSHILGLRVPLYRRRIGSGWPRGWINHTVWWGISCRWWLARRRVRCWWRRIHHWKTKFKGRKKNPLMKSDYWRLAEN